MAKKIVFCADGTWNGPEKLTKVSATEDADNAGELSSAPVTNVVKLFSNLSGQVTPETISLHNEQEKICTGSGGEVEQVAKYVHGVGDSKNVIIKLLGGMFGMGVIARIVRGFTFISRNYKAGDEIHIIGFSRGAYTARALAGMIATVGLLDVRKYDPDDKAEAYRLGIAAWSKAKGVKLQGAHKFTDLADHMLGLLQQLIGDSLRDDALISDVKIKSVAVWDTVGSMGIPIYAGDRRFDVFRFTDTSLSSKVENGFHAMALDELRVDFPVTKWDDRPGIRQIWFVGAHADVGGGYPPEEARLSDIALDWMAAQLKNVAVLFSAPPAYVPRGDAMVKAIHAPWENPPFNLMPHAQRQPDQNDIFHPSVVRRWKEDPRYRPGALTRIAQLNIDKLTLDA
jgi:uncharacterized protein (DUF2235 family)